MRFSATIDDPKSFDDIIKAAASAVSFLQDEELTLKILPDALSFVCATGLNQGYFMEIKLLEQEIFSVYKMEGISDEKNVIIIQLQRSQFMHIFRMTEEQVKIKLVKRNNEPKLTVEYKSSNLVKTIPIKIVKNHFLDDYMTPNINPTIVGLVVKPMDFLEKLFKAHTNLEMETFQMRLIGEGYIFISCRNPYGIELNVLIEDLVSVEDIEHHGDTGSFRVNAEVLNQFFRCLPNEGKKCEIRVSDLNQIVINVKYSNINHVLYMSALRNEAFES